ncbi:S-acyltransferase [Psidium guajava]|nr:S-acyltransferase [Psidium guajava]
MTCSREQRHFVVVLVSLFRLVNTALGRLSRLHFVLDACCCFHEFCSVKEGISSDELDVESPDKSSTRLQLFKWKASSSSRLPRCVVFPLLLKIVVFVQVACLETGPERTDP